MATSLPSWNDGAAKRAIVIFVEGAVTDGPGFIAPADRVATFDNDGTLWVEQPMPPQFDFVFRRWATEAQADPSLATHQPYKAILERDEAFFGRVAINTSGAEKSMAAATERGWTVVSMKDDWSSVFADDEAPT